MTSIWKRKQFLAYSLCILTIALFYAQVSSFQWAWDDYILFFDSSRLREGSINWYALSSPVLPGTTYFRPGTMLSFALELRLLGTSPVTGHIINLVLFLLNCTAVYSIGKALFEQLCFDSVVVRASFATLFYGLHPTMTESVAWVCGRFDLMTTLFVLLGIFASLQKSTSRPWLQPITVGIAFLCGLLCKEMAITMPALIFCMLTIIKSKNNSQGFYSDSFWVIKKYKWLWLSQAAALAYYLLLRFLSVGTSTYPDDHYLPDSFSNNLSGRFIFVLDTIFFYVRMIFLPFSDLSPLHPFDFDSIFKFVDLITALGTTALIIIMIALIKRKNVTACIMLTTIISLLPVAQIIPLRLAGAIGAERFLALPMVFAALALASVQTFSSNLFSVKLQRTVFSMLSFGWFVLAAGCLYVSIPLWRTDLTLWTWIYETHPDSIFARNSYLTGALRANRFDLARPVFNKIVESNQLDAHSQLIFGHYLIQTGEPDEGINYIIGALNIYPRPTFDSNNQIDEQRQRDISYGYSTLATGYLLKKDYQKALDAVHNANRFQSEFGLSQLTESYALDGLGRHEEADKVFAQALSNIPEATMREEAITRRQAFIDGLKRRG